MENITTRRKYYETKTKMCSISNVSTSVIKKTSSCDESMRFFQAAGRFHESIAYGGDYTPKVGDIFFTGPNASDATHTGIVVGVSSTEITAIHGNYSNKVVRNTYSLTDTSLLGFGNPNYESSTHTYAWEYDSTNHWGDCDACGHMISVTAHSLVWKSTVSNHWKTCSACGYSTSTSVHTYVWKTNTASHWKACSSCGFKLDSTAHTWVKKTTYYQCSVCGLKQTNIASTTSLDDIETTNIAMLY